MTYKWLWYGHNNCGDFSHLHIEEGGVDPRWWAYFYHQENPYHHNIRKNCTGDIIAIATIITYLMRVHANNRNVLPL